MRIRFLRPKPKPKTKYCDLVKAPDLREISLRELSILHGEKCRYTSLFATLCRTTVFKMSMPDEIYIRKKKNTD